MLPLGSCFPTRTFVFDRTVNYLVINCKYLVWHRKVKYSLSEIDSIQWVTKPVYTGNTIVNVQFLKLVRRKKNGKMHLIPIRHAVHPDHLETSTTIAFIRRFLDC